MKTLNQVLTEKSLTAAQLETSSNLDVVARELLKSRGVESPSSALVEQTKTDVLEAVKSNKWEQFVATPKARIGDKKTLDFFVKESDVEKLKTDTWARSQLCEKIASHYGSKLTDSEKNALGEKIIEAIESGEWKTFEPKVETRLVAAMDNAMDKDRFVFSENEVIGKEDRTASRLALSPLQLKTLVGEYESGKAGMLLAATFIQRDQRANADFSHALGAKAWAGYVRGFSALDEVPQGKLVEKFDSKLVCLVNEKVDEGPKGFFATVKSWFGGSSSAGTLRDAPAFTSPIVAGEAQIKEAEKLGLKVTKKSPIKNSSDFTVVFEHPSAKDVPKRLDALVNKAKAALIDPKKGDTVAAAADFYRGLVALHPFGDHNERTAALVTNRLLREFSLPPMIFRSLETPFTDSITAFRETAAEACVRGKKFIDRQRNAWPDYLSSHGINVKVVEQSPDAPVTIDGARFDLGTDGFLYDLTGRPHLVFDGELQPLAQLEYYTIARRLIARPKDNAIDQLKKMTSETRAAYDSLIAGKPVSLTRVSDEKARDADVVFEMRPSVALATWMFALADVDAAEAEWQFKVGGSRGTQTTDVVTQYSQADLELWMVEQAFSDGGHSTLASAMRAERGRLFAKAKEALSKTKVADKATDANPLGISKYYEKLMLDHSPLRFASLDEAIAKEGDDEVTVWRGDYAIARWLGMAPNNDIREADARAVGKQRASQGVIGHLVEELNKLEGSAISSRYICTTSDLALLVNSFANSKKSNDVNLAHMPSFAQKSAMWLLDRLTTAVDDKADKPAEKTQSAADAAKDRDENAASLVTGKGARELKDKFGVPGSALRLQMREGKLSVDVSRRAFALRLDKRALLPGLRIQRTQTFSHEQEMHGTQRVWPCAVQGVYEAKDLGREVDGSGMLVPEYHVPKPPVPPKVAVAAPNGATADTGTAAKATWPPGMYGPLPPDSGI